MRDVDDERGPPAAAASGRVAASVAASEATGAADSTERAADPQAPAGVAGHLRSKAPSFSLKAHSCIVEIEDSLLLPPNRSFFLPHSPRSRGEGKRIGRRPSKFTGSDAGGENL